MKAHAAKIIVFIASSLRLLRISLVVGERRSVTTAPRGASLRIHFASVGAEHLLGDIAPAVIRIVEVMGSLGGHCVQHEKLLRPQLAAKGRDDRTGWRGCGTGWRRFGRHVPSLLSPAWLRLPEPALFAR